MHTLVKVYENGGGGGGGEVVSAEHHLPCPLWQSGWTNESDQINDLVAPITSSNLSRLITAGVFAWPLQRVVT